MCGIAGIVSLTDKRVELDDVRLMCASLALRGMFAFALWDERRRRLLVARDRIGIKPLYYAETNGRLAFASEVKALLQLEIAPNLNWGSFGHLLTFLTTPRTESIVHGIHKLDPGHQ